MPFQILLLLFIGVPIFELALLFELHLKVGFLSTVMLVFATGILGAGLVKMQGVATLFEIQQRIRAGELPALQLIEGILILLAGAVLVTPGLATYTVGFLLLIPHIIRRIGRRLQHWIEQRIQQNYMHVQHEGPFFK